MSTPEPLRLVDPDTGLITESCPQCQPLMDAVVHELETVTHQRDEVTRKLHGMAAQLGRWRADRAREAETDSLWPLGISLFLDWRVATHHISSRWTADRFWMLKPYLEADGYATCRYAVWGLAANPMVKRVTKDYQEVYDSWELCFDRGRDKFERYANAGVAIFGGDLPLTDIDQLLRVHRYRAGVR